MIVMKFRRHLGAGRKAIGARGAQSSRASGAETGGVVSAMAKVTDQLLAMARAAGTAIAKPH